MSQSWRESQSLLGPPSSRAPVTFLVNLESTTSSRAPGCAGPGGSCMYK